ncbi:short chain dehydrogenase [Membranihabitans maritimus]|uniref:short chain dehydrogenase n=1 Tax=Membranihabitans maritimus TaxID=2904244 RepID=UPI001F0271C2|nr:short chain dehydrogenase [Membranihabitans maritimus]
MKILLVGGNGTIGKRIAERLKSDHELIIAGRSTGDIKLDMSNGNDIDQLFQKTGKIDALVITAGSAPVKPLEELSFGDFQQGFESKMMGQINLALKAIPNIKPGGSITLTSGILSHDPIPYGTVLSTINSAVNGFVIGSYGELLYKGIRINAVSPALVEDSAEKLSEYFPGHTPVGMKEVVDGYIKSLKSNITGKILNIPA